MKCCCAACGLPRQPGRPLRHPESPRRQGAGGGFCMDCNPSCGQAGAPGVPHRQTRPQAAGRPRHAGSRSPVPADARPGVWHHACAAYSWPGTGRRARRIYATSYTATVRKPCSACISNTAFSDTTRTFPAGPPAWNTCPCFSVFHPQGACQRAGSVFGRIVRAGGARDFSGRRLHRHPDKTVPVRADLRCPCQAHA